jgi:hypothetical protein
MYSQFVKRFNAPKGFGVIAVEDGPVALDHHMVIDVNALRSAGGSNPTPCDIDPSTKNPATLTPPSSEP